MELQRQQEPGEETVAFQQAGKDLPGTTREVRSEPWQAVEWRGKLDRRIRQGRAFVEDLREAGS